MRSRYWLSSAALLIPITLGAALLPLSFQPGSRVWVVGTSTARSYRCESTQVEGVAQAPTAELAHLNEVTGARVTIPIATLDCRNATMNGHMRTALKAAQYPTLSLQVSSATLTAAAEGSAVRMSGTLTIAGTTRPVNIDGTVVSEAGQLRVRGTKDVVMTEFGVRPPSLMMGTRRVRPNATIGFDVLLKP
jgi:polyisoprenoid-binding protein YceI